MQGAGILARTTGKPIGRQQHQPPRTIINPALCPALPVSAGKQARRTIQGDDHHNLPVPHAITVNANTARSNRIVLNGEIREVERLRERRVW
jgi:hypothetical protein